MGIFFSVEFDSVVNVPGSVQAGVLPRESSLSIRCKYGSRGIKVSYCRAWRQIRRLCFTKPNAGSSYCTANVVSGNSHIVTAIYCVYVQYRGFSRNVVFVPAERFGVVLYRTFRGVSAAVMGKWNSEGGRRWDVGLIRLVTQVSGSIFNGSNTRYGGVRPWRHVIFRRWRECAVGIDRGHGPLLREG